MEQEMQSEAVRKDSKLSMPVAVVLAGVIIAIALILFRGTTGAKLGSGGTLNVKDSTELREIKPVSSEDHIRGDIRKAKVAVVEFSDLQCPYCKQLHPTLIKMMEAYGSEVVWVYRHFPLESIHPNARPAAHASECVAALGGNEAFWTFVDGVFNSESDPFSKENMAALASKAGVDTAAFQSCQDSGKYDQKITDSVDEAGLAGAQGTPDLTVINLKTKEAVHVGADPRTLAQVLEQMTK